MAAFGISFPKITLCRSSTSKPDANHISSAPPATTARTLSLSIKNVPSQPLHYDVSTTTMKKKTPTFTTILAIDGETKQLPKNLSVFNELQLDEGAEDIDEKRQTGRKSSDVSMSASSSVMRIIDQCPDVQCLAHNGSTKDSFADERQCFEERRSNQTFTPPTSSLSYDSPSTNDLHATLSSLSVDLPPLKYALEKFLVDGDDAIINDSVYEIAEEFTAGCALLHQDCNENSRGSNITTPISNCHQQDRTETIELHSMHEEYVKSEALSHPSPISNSIKWYVSELRIHQPLIYRTQWTNRQTSSTDRKWSHSANDLTQVYNIEKLSDDGKYRIISRKTNDIARSTLSLQNFPFYQQPTRHRSDDNVLLNNYLSSTDDDDFHDLPSDEDNQRLSPLLVQSRRHRSLARDDTLIRNESVKKKLFDILNDDELENACLEDMSDEFEAMSITHAPHYHDLPMANSFSCSSSDDDALYSSPPNELQFPPPLPLFTSSSYHENLSASLSRTTEYYLGRSRLITTTSLEKISSHHNAYDHFSSSCTLRSSYEPIRPSWYTSPSPQWRTDDPFPMPSVLKRHSSRRDEHIHLNQLDAEYDTKENQSVHKYTHHLHRQEPIHVSYPSTPLVGGFHTSASHYTRQVIQSAHVYLEKNVVFFFPSLRRLFQHFSRRAMSVITNTFLVNRSINSSDRFFPHTMLR